MEVDGLRCERGERALFAGLALKLGAGEVVWLRGRNGRGKTTLLRTLAGLSAPAAGRVRWPAPPPAARLEQPWQPVLYLGHANALKEDLSAAETLEFYARLHGARPDAAAITAALTAVGVGALGARAVRTLSQGQRRRVALARLALDLPFAVWLLDEPFDALDSDGITRLCALIRRHADGGGAVLFTSHQAVPALQPAPAEFDLDALPAVR